MGNAERQWGEKVVLLYDGAKAMGVRHLAAALVPGSSSSSLKREVCKISWDDTSIEPHVAGEIVHFIDSNDVTQVPSSSFY
jgi:xanthosine utilization system XapX-like protein